MDERNAIPIEVLRKVVYQPVAEEYISKPVFADNQSILDKVKPKLKNPYKTLDKDQRRRWKEYNEEYEAIKKEALNEDDFNEFKNYISRHFKRLLRKLDVQDMARITHSTCISMGTYFNDIREKLRPSWVFEKIRLTSWHWGYKSANYNEICHAYNSLASFDIPLKDFSVEVDTSSSYNKKGYSQYTRTFLDTELAYVIKHKGKHVLTIGFNIILDEEKTIHIRQIQCKENKGNRWMYKMPKHYVEYIIDRMFEAYQGYDIYFIKTSTVIKDISDAYINRIERELNYYNEIRDPDRKEKQQRHVQAAMDPLYHFDAIDAPRMKYIYGKRMKGYRRKGVDKKRQLNLLQQNILNL